MNKKIIALTMALVLCLASTVAFAAGSKTTKDVVSATTVDTTIAVSAPTAESKAELDAIAAFVNNGSAVVGYFQEDVQTEITSALPEGVAADDLKMDEFFPLASNGVINTETALTLSTAATYEDTDAVIVMGGVSDGEKVIWQVLPATIVDGKIVVTLPADFCANIANGSAMITVLSNKAK